MKHRLLIATVAAVCVAAMTRAEAWELRVCADPNNLPFSNSADEGFENKIVALLAADLNAHVTYVWWAQRRGYVRKTLKAGLCDLWPGVAAGVGMLATTAPYYRSTYVFVTRADRGLEISSLDDPRLRQLSIGVQMIGNDATNTPPAHALARRDIIDNVRGYSVFGDYAKPDPPAAIIDAVARGDIDVAIAWGPLAGYFAAQEPYALRLVAVQPADDGHVLPMTFSIAMGLRKGNVVLQQKLETELVRNRAAITSILAAYHIPVLPPDGGEEAR